MGTGQWVRKAKRKTTRDVFPLLLRIRIFSNPQFRHWLLLFLYFFSFLHVFKVCSDNHVFVSVGLQNRMPLRCYRFSAFFVSACFSWFVYLLLQVSGFMLKRRPAVRLKPPSDSQEWLTITLNRWPSGMLETLLFHCVGVLSHGYHTRRTCQVQQDHILQPTVVN